MKRTKSDKHLPHSTLKYVLEGLVPYTDANLKLSFKPGLFFADLENISKQKNSISSFKQAYYRAINKGLIVIVDGIPELTAKGRKKITTFKPSKLDKNTYLMITFDIPESERYKRDRLRTILQTLDFKQTQKSIWVTKLDYYEILKLEIEYSQLESFVKIYEAKEIK
mgnify:CR=1 FL=1|jgi:CRISPR/Cas system-associated endoribonuclease Cas2